MKDMGYGKSYKYPHDFPGHFVEQQYLPDKIAGTRLWESQGNRSELKLQEYLDTYWKSKK